MSAPYGGEQVVTGHYTHEPASTEILPDALATPEIAQRLDPELREHARAAMTRMARQRPAIVQETPPPATSEGPHVVLEGLSLPIAAYTAAMHAGRVSLEQVDKWSDEVQAVESAGNNTISDSELDAFYEAVDAFHTRRPQASSSVGIRVPQLIEHTNEALVVDIEVAESTVETFLTTVDVQSFAFTAEETAAIITALKAEAVLLDNNQYNEQRIDRLFVILRKRLKYPDEVRPVILNFRKAIHRYNKRNGTSQAVKARG